MNQEISRTNLPTTHIILYDGSCGVCTKFSDFFYKKDKKKKFQFIPFQEVSIPMLATYDLNIEQCEKKIHMLHKTGKIFKGVHCINILWLSFFPYSMISILVYLFPPFLLCEIWLYSIVASKRHLISQWLGLNSCRLK